MNADDTIVVFGELESDSETIFEASEAGTFIFKNVSSQTDFDYDDDSGIPVIFCGLFSSSVCEASTQANIPIQPNPGVRVKTEIIPPLNFNVTKIKTEAPDPLSEKEKDAHLEKTIENVIQGCSIKKKAPSIDLLFDSDSDAIVDDGDDDLPVSISSKDGKQYPSSGEDPTNSEYSSDNDVAFWEKMKKKAKRFKQKKLTFLGPDNKRYAKYPTPAEDKNSLFSHRANVSQQPFKQTLQQEGQKQDQNISNTKSVANNNNVIISNNNNNNNNSNNNNNNTNDDWITDDEVDNEEAEPSIDTAFKLEWKKKRHPYNSKKKDFVCEVCGKLYSKHHYLREHIVRDHKEHEQAKKYPYNCQHCNRLYSGQRQLIYHQQQHSGPCEICGLVLKCSGVFWRHRRNHDSQCDICGKKFHSRSSLDMHIKVKHLEKTVPCPLCPRKFPFKSLLNSHIARVHQSRIPLKFKCDMCDFSAKTEGALRIHQSRIHNIPATARRYSCSECKTAFRTQVAFDKHMVLHKEKVTFTCKLCMQTFFSRADLITHKKTAHTNSANEIVRIQQPVSATQQLLLCEICNVVLPNQKQLNLHLKTHGIPVDGDLVREFKEEPMVEESIELAEVDEVAVAVKQINVNNEEFQVEENIRDKEDASIFGFPDGINYQVTRSAILMPANVVPPDVNLVDIDGVQYHVIRGNQ